MNLYEKAKRGLIGKRALPVIPYDIKVLPVRQVRVFTTKGQLGTPTYHIVDPDGREIAFHRQDAVVAYYALGASLK